MAEIPTKPYLIRALYEWCVDSGFTPQILVAVDSHTRVPAGYVKDGHILLNVGAAATRNLTMDNDWIQFSARFSGVSHEISIPVPRVAAIIARENGMGERFEVSDTVPVGESESSAPVSAETPIEPAPPPKGRPALKIVK